MEKERERERAKKRKHPMTDEKREKNSRERGSARKREGSTRNDSVADVATPEIAWRDALRCGDGDRDDDEDGDDDESTLPEASDSVHS